METLFSVIFLTQMLSKKLTLGQRRLRNIYVLTLFLRNLRCTWVSIPYQFISI